MASRISGIKGSRNMSNIAPKICPNAVMVVDSIWLFFTIRPIPSAIGANFKRGFRDCIMVGPGSTFDGRVLPGEPSGGIGVGGFGTSNRGSCWPDAGGNIGICEPNFIC
jgi:hypothetical protein